MRKYKRILILAVAICFVWGLVPWVIVQAQYGVTVSVSAPDQVVEGADFTARINIDNVMNFDATNYDVIFDPAVLQVSNVNSGLISGTTIPVDMWSVISPGRLRVIHNVPGISGVSGSGYLSEIGLHVIGSAGSSSQIDLANGILSDNSANEILATWVGDTVYVNGNSENPTPTPTPTITPTLTPTPTPTITPTPTPTLTPSVTPTPTPTPTSTYSPPIGGGGSIIFTTPTLTPTLTPGVSPTPTPVSTQTFTSTVIIRLEPGWNLFSFNVMPTSSSIETVLSSIEGQYTVVETFNRETLSYYAGESSVGNTLKTLDPYHGYWIKMNQSGTLSITGTIVAATTPLSLQEGWNLVSYLVDGPLPVTTALSSIDGLYAAVLGYDGQAVSFYPTVPLEMNTLEVLRPTYGYWIRMSAPATLVYSSS